MENWEKIFKDKLGGYSSPLPDGDFESIREEMSERRPLVDIPSKEEKSSQRYVVWIAVPALATAVLAILLIVPHKNDSSEIVNPKPEPVIIALADSSLSVEENKAQHIASTPSPHRKVKTCCTPSVYSEGDSPSDIDAIEIRVETVTPDSTHSETPSLEQKIDSLRNSIPYSSNQSPLMANNVNTGLAIAGGGILGVAAAGTLVALRPGQKMDYYGQDMADQPSSEDTPETFSRQIVNVKHYIPLKAGLSIQFPITDRWKINTGLEYSLYCSKFFYNDSSTAEQLAHYIGIPLRADWSFVHRKHFDAYIGAGINADYCIAATRYGNPESKDGFSFSVLGAGGVQYKFNDHIGLYLEPELSYVLPFGSRVLSTYRTNYPVTFSMAFGLRFIL